MLWVALQGAPQQGFRIVCLIRFCIICACNNTNTDDDDDDDDDADDNDGAMNVDNADTNEQ